MRILLALAPLALMTAQENQPGPVGQRIINWIENLPPGEISAPAPQNDPTPVPLDDSTPAPLDDSTPVPLDDPTRSPEDESQAPSSDNSGDSAEVSSGAPIVLFAFISGVVLSIAIFVGLRLRRSSDSEDKSAHYNIENADNGAMLSMPSGIPPPAYNFTEHKEQPPQHNPTSYRPSRQLKDDFRDSYLTRSTESLDSERDSDIFHSIT